MIELPRLLNRIHAFKMDGSLYIADLDRCEVIEVDRIILDLLGLCESHTKEGVIRKLRRKYRTEEIESALEDLSSMAERGLIFSLGDGPSTYCLPKERLRIYVPSPWTEDITRLPAGTNVAFHYMIKAIAKYMDLYFCGPGSKIDDGIYTVPLTIPDIFSFPPIFDGYDFDGILAIHNMWDPSLIYLLKCVDVPMVVQIHAPRGHSGTEINSILMHYAAMREYDSFMAPSSCVAKFYSRFVLNPAMFRAIPNGVDPEAFRPMEKTAAKRYVAEILGDPRVLELPVIGFLSRFQPEKGAITFIKAAWMNPDLLFLAVGPSPRGKEFRAFPENIIYAGMQPRGALPIFYNAFDIFCFPTMSGEETFGLALAEAMACGVPPVVPRFDGLPEVVGDAGVVVDAEEFQIDIGSFAAYVSPESLSHGIRRLIEDPGMREDLGRKARERALELSWDRNARAHLELFEELIRRRRLRGNLDFFVLFSPRWDMVKDELSAVAILMNLTREGEIRLMIPEGNVEGVEEGIGLSLLGAGHTIHEVEAVLMDICGEEKARDVMRRIYGFIDCTG